MSDMTFEDVMQAVDQLTDAECQALIVHLQRRQSTLQSHNEDSEPQVYATANEYGDRVLVDNTNGIISPVKPLTLDELVNSGFIGYWADRRDEIADSVEWLKAQRRKQQEKDDPWRGRSIS